MSKRKNNKKYSNTRRLSRKDVANRLKKSANISYEEYDLLYKMAKKANQKGYNLKYRGSAIVPPNYSLQFKYIHTREDYERYYQSIKNVLRREYRSEMNAKYRQTLANNLKSFFDLDKSSQAEAEEITNRILSLSDKELKTFFDDYADDIQYMLYDSEQEFTKQIKEDAMLTRDRLDFFEQNNRQPLPKSYKK